METALGLLGMWWCRQSRERNSLGVSVAMIQIHGANDPLVQCFSASFKLCFQSSEFRIAWFLPTVIWVEQWTLKSGTIRFVLRITCSLFCRACLGVPVTPYKCCHHVGAERCFWHLPSWGAQGCCNSLDASRQNIQSTTWCGKHRQCLTQAGWFCPRSCNCMQNVSAFSKDHRVFESKSDLWICDSEDGYKAERTRTLRLFQRSITWGTTKLTRACFL